MRRSFLVILAVLLTSPAAIASGNRDTKILPKSGDEIVYFTPTWLFGRETRHEGTILSVRNDTALVQPSNPHRKTESIPFSKLGVRVSPCYSGFCENADAVYIRKSSGERKTMRIRKIYSNGLAFVSSPTDPKYGFLAELKDLQLGILVDGRIYVSERNNKILPQENSPAPRSVQKTRPINAAQ